MIIMYKLPSLKQRVLFLIAFYFLSSGLCYGDGKKGVAISNKVPDAAHEISCLNADWYYTWAVDDVPDVKKARFVPMLWGKNSLTANNFEKLLGTKNRYILFLNEPDHPQQANIDVNTSIRLLQDVEERLSDVAIIGPGAASSMGEWVSGFMAHVKAENLKLDAMSVHWYGPPDSSAFLSYLDKVYAKYNRPLWITEFAVADWGGDKRGYNKYSEDQVSVFLSEALAGIEARTYILRFAWPVIGKNNFREALKTSSLFDTNGKLTKLGLIYARSGLDVGSVPTGCIN